MMIKHLMNLDELHPFAISPTNRIECDFAKFQQMQMASEKFPAGIDISKIRFYNLGATCYINTGLQILFRTTNFIQDIAFSHIDPSSIDNILYSLLEVASQISQSTVNAIDLTEFVAALRKSHPEFEPNTQHDCDDFLAVVWGSLPNNLKAKWSLIFDQQIVCSNNPNHIGKKQTPSTK
jgi:uncharacterized UBP type Zn finger protein